jgi:hypothetical protein
MRRPTTFLATALAAVLMGGTALLASPATSVASGAATAAPKASGPFRIARINYEQGATLHSEYVVVKNVTRHRHVLTGFQIVDPNDNQRYRFPKTVLRAGMSVTLHTGHGRNRPHHRYWGQDEPMWNNDGDQAQLRNRSGKVVDRCSYDGSEGGTTGCSG